MLLRPRWISENSVLRLFLLVVVVCQLSAESANYSLVTFDAPGSVFGTHATGINNQNYIVGYYEDAQGNGQGFLRDPSGALTSIKVPGASSTLPEGINDSGVISGIYYNGGAFGFIRDVAGNFTSFNVPGEEAPGTEGFGINNQNQILVYSQSIAGPSWVRSSDGTSYAQISVPGSNYTVGFGINDSGQTVGGAVGGIFKTAPFLIEADHVQYSILNVPGATEGATAHDINNLGDIVGIGLSTSGNIPFIRHPDGAFEIPQVPGENFQEVNGINDNGWIVGFVSDAAGAHAFFAQPILDRTPPVISGMPPASCVLWPPNHKLIPVATVIATDAASGIASGSFQVTGTSNEPSDSSNPDIVITPNGSGGYLVQLRADRLGGGTGRVYTLKATATDLAGNTATATTTCTVPHDQGKN